MGKVFAQSLGNTLQNEIGSLEGSKIATTEDLMSKIISIAVPAAVLCVVVLVIYAGYLLISSQGNPDKINEGKDILTNAIIGFLIILLSTAILLLLSNSLGLDIYG